MISDHALQNAAKAGDDAKVKQALREGADVNMILYGDTLLMEAVRRNRINVVRTLLQAGADVNLGSYYGGLPLFSVDYTSPVGVDILKLLLNAGADPEKVRPYGFANSVAILQTFCNDPLKISTPHRSEIVLLLLSYGAKAHPWFLETAESVYQAEVLELFVKQGLDDIDELEPELRITGLHQTITYLLNFTQPETLTEDHFDRLRLQFASQAPMYDQWPLMKAYIKNGAYLNPDWIRMFRPEDQERMLADARFAKLRQIIIFREYLKSIGQVPGSATGSKFFPGTKSNK